HRGAHELFDAGGVRLPGAAAVVAPSPPTASARPVGLWDRTVEFPVSSPHVQGKDRGFDTADRDVGEEDHVGAIGTTGGSGASLERLPPLPIERRASALAPLGTELEPLVLLAREKFGFPT